MDILCRSLSVPTEAGWQYHSRSDRHSKIACWSMLFDLLVECSLLRSHIGNEQVAFGINHEMRDYRQNRKKDLDLVVCRAGGNISDAGMTFADLRWRYGIVLSEDEEYILSQLPTVWVANPATVLVAVEAKACMTAFIKAIPRLHDELRSSHSTIHGDTESAIAAAFALLNCADTFYSYTQNDYPIGTGRVAPSSHRQPSDIVAVMAKLRELPRRSRIGEDGFDVLAIGVVDCVNDGSPICPVTAPPAPQPGDIYNYASSIQRLAHIYATRFGAL